MTSIMIHISCCKCVAQSLEWANDSDQPGEKGRKWPTRQGVFVLAPPILPHSVSSKWWLKFIKEVRHISTSHTLKSSDTALRLHCAHPAALTMHTILLLVVTSGLVLLQTTQGEWCSWMLNLLKCNFACNYSLLQSERNKQNEMCNCNPV